MPRELANKVALVTGDASGMGLGSKHPIGGVGRPEECG
jgi:NAD(P)-dependent dehydrogenase (short-subunit alcohol dehydrogenase family)